MQKGSNFSSPRGGICVDAQNLYHSAKNLYRGRVSYPDLIRHLVGDRQLIRSLAYVVKSEGVVESPKPDASRRPRVWRGGAGDARHPENTHPLSSEASFFEALTNAGLELRMKDLQVFGDGLKKADWDVGMAVDAIRMSSFLDVVVIVTGDGDFLPLIDYLKWGVGRLVEVAAFKRSASAKIQEAADRFINIEEIPRAIMRARG